jgi:environmental stress-induced protein Ves
MFEIIYPSQFNTVPWKNGKGETTELAISDGGTLDDFDWRISIASVADNGLFSDFSGIDRNLVLIEGNGIKLTHDEQTVDDLKALLDIAVFDGGSRTIGELPDGPIKDFNIMSKAGKYRAEVKTYIARQTVKLSACDHCFVYCLEGEAMVEPAGPFLPEGHLLHVADEDIEVCGQMMIVAVLKSCK